MPLQLLSECVEKWRLEELDQLLGNINNRIADSIEKQKVEYSKSHMNIVLNIMGKSILTTREILIIAAAGYPDGALSLSRNLYEQLIIMAFFDHQSKLESFDKLVEDYYTDYDINYLKDRIAEHVWKDDKADISELASKLKKAKEKAHRKVKGDYWWSGMRTFKDLTEFVKKNTTDEALPIIIGSCHASYICACTTLHASCRGNILRLKDNAEPFIVDTTSTNDKQYLPLSFAVICLIYIVGITYGMLKINYNPLCTKLNELASFYYNHYV